MIRRVHSNNAAAVAAFMPVAVLGWTQKSKRISTELKSLNFLDELERSLNTQSFISPNTGST